MVVVEEDGARGGGLVRVGSEGLFKGLTVGLTVFRRCWQPPTASPVNRPSDAGCFLTAFEYEVDFISTAS